MMLTMLRRGVSLVEVLVVTGLMTLLTLILTEIYFASYKVFEHGSAHTDIQQRCRETVNRIVPLIMGASEPALTQDAVYLPDNVDASRGSELWFYSPDDLFGNAVYDPRNPVFYFYRVRQLSGDVVLEKLAMPGSCSPCVSCSSPMTDMAMGSIMMQVAVLLIHMLITAVAIMNPSTMPLALVPVNRTMVRAMRR